MLGGGVADGLVNREDGASGLASGGQHVKADNLWLPNELVHHVVDTVLEDVDSLPEVFIGLHVELS